MYEDVDLLDPEFTDADLLNDAGGKRGRQSGAGADGAMEPAGLSWALEAVPPGLARAERAKKFGVEKAANPLDARASAAGGVGKTKEAGLWEKRRDAAADEVPRDEAIYVYGTARTPTSRPASSRALLAPFP